MALAVAWPGSIAACHSLRPVQTKLSDKLGAVRDSMCPMQFIQLNKKGNQFKLFAFLYCSSLAFIPN
jgi:hypothetical protein